MNAKVFISHIFSSEGFSTGLAWKWCFIQVHGTYVRGPTVSLAETLMAEVTGVGLDTCVDVQVNIAILLRCEHLVALLADESAFS